VAVIRFPSRLRNAAQFLARKGFRHFVRESIHQLANRYYERRLGVDTDTRVQLADLGISNPDSRDSMPISYYAFYSALKLIPLPPSACTFLDYGAGKGRAVCAAATLPFRKIVGVEFSRVLIEAALANLERMKHRRTRQVAIHEADATEYEIPADVNLIYFFNPFAGPTLRKVVDKISSSLRAHPRLIYIVFFNNDHFDDLVRNQSWIVRTHQATYYPDITLGVYETRPT